MPDVGPVELFLVLVVVVLLFGGTRLAEIGGSLGKGVREFRKGIADDPDELPAATSSEPSTPVAAKAPGCSICGAVNAAGARFCSNCGTALSV